MNAGPPPADSCQGDPCNAGTGNNYQNATDYSGLGAYPIKFVRTYNSGGSAPSAIIATTWGSQWRGTYDRSMTFTSNSTQKNVSLLRQDGSTKYFEQAIGTAIPPLTTTTWTSNANVIGTLVVTVNSGGSPTGWAFTNENDEVERYNTAGKLLSITNRAGLTQTLTYSDGTAGANGGYVLTAAGVATTTVLPAGKLIRVTDPAGRILKYGYDAVGRVVLMTDPTGGKYHYAYSDASTLTANLTSVTYPDGKIRTYRYGEAANVSATPNSGVSYAHSLTGIIDENGNRFASWTYGANGLAASSEQGAFGSGIDHVGMVYTAPNASGNSTTAVTDPRGNVRTYNFSTLLNVVQNSGITGLPCDGCTAAFTYDANGNVSSRTDFNGNTTCYSFDLTRNLELYRVEGLPPGMICPATLSSYAPPAGSTIRLISTTWNPSYRLPLVVADPLRITTYTYDTHGNLQTKTIQPTTDTTGGAGTSAVAAGTPRTWTYTYDTAGRVLTRDGPRTDVADITTNTYDAQENLSTVKNSLGQLTTLSGYDANGRVGTLSDPNGLVTNLVYDARGRLTSSTTGTDETTTYTYDGAGDLTVVSLPSGASYTYTYDAAHRLTAIQDSLGNTIQYTLDVMNKRIKEQLFNAAGTVVRTHSRVFDVLNHLYQDIGAVNQTTTYAYDADGNRISSTDPLSLTSSYRYDALNRLIGYTDANNGISQYSYDGLDQLIQVIDPKTLSTQYQRDGLGNLAQQTSPDTGVTSYSDDAAGNVLTRTDAKGQVATFTYDALNRVTSVTYTGGTSAPQVISYTYDQGTNGLGRLTQVSDVTGTSNYSYDQHGRLIGEVKVTHGVTYTSGYSYDTQGRLNSMTYPSGRVVNYSFDSMGRISQITTALNGVTAILASNIVYEPFGGVHSFNFGDGLTPPVKSYIRQRDQDGRIASYTLSDKTLSIGYDADSRISFVSDPTDLTNPANYTYDPLSRLTSYAQGSISQGYSYDADGNRSSQSLGTTLSSFSYVPNSNMLASIQTGAITQTLVQDANGATISDATRQYGYDNRGRLISTTTAQGIINYEVNALGLRVRKQVPYANTDTLYHYDLQGHLIGESPTGTSQFTKEYIYLGDQPVAVMQ